MTPREQRQRVNDEYLAAALAWLRLRLKWYAEEEVHAAHPAPGHRVLPEKVAEAARAMAAAGRASPKPALLALADRFLLSPFERDVLLLCAAMEFDTHIPHLCAHAQDPPQPYPTLALAFALFEEPAWDVRTPGRPLFFWHFVEVDPAGRQPLQTSRLYADPRIVNYLKGLNNYLDERLANLLTPGPPAAGEAPLPP